MRDYTGKRRNMKHALVIGALFAASTLWAASANAAQSDAELILYNGNIRTPGGAVKALAVDGKGLIVALGDLDEVALYDFVLTPAQVAGHYEAVQGNMCE